tara:strand:- start:12310 stop:13260 length:951 start_codon:yes stop_codon:yes gene_type:complete
MKNIHRLRYCKMSSNTIPSIGALQAFRQAAVHLSFRRAADDLGLSPSAVSHQIRGLEALLGVRLFARTPHAVQLTSAGETYLEAVVLALDQLTLAGQNLLDRSNRGRHELRVSALPFFASTILLPHLAQLTDYYAGLHLRLEATHQYADFDASDVDVAIRYGKERTSGLRYEAILDVASMPVCSPSLASQISKLSDLDGHTLIHVSVQPESWSKWLAERKIGSLNQYRALWVDSVPAAIEAAEHGLGIALAMHPLVCAREGFGDRLIAPFTPSKKENTYYLVMRSEQVGDRRILAFRKWLKAAVAASCHTQSPPSL